MEEQQTWEDMEDDYEEGSNEKNIVEQYEKMKNSASQEDQSLQSFRNSTGGNGSPDIKSGEFKLGVG